MTLNEALNILGINDILKVTSQEVNKRYKQLIVKNHPDVGGSSEKTRQIIEAKRIVINTCKQLEAFVVKDKQMCIVDIGLLSLVYDNKSIPIRNSTTGEYLNRGNIGDYKVLLEADVGIVRDGVTSRYNKLFIRNTQDIYNLDIPIRVDKLNTDVEVTVIFGDKKIDATVRTMTRTIRIDTGRGIILNINLEKKIITGD